MDALCLTTVPVGTRLRDSRPVRIGERGRPVGLMYTDAQLAGEVVETGQRLINTADTHTHTHTVRGYSWALGLWRVQRDAN